ncbi:MAG: MogA/MoaB family molybdenum cofactor biosynthesis protein [Candidatus Brockarchaeota archaeon]|nr:MogA/MoaB family molybdenum cofactor biosynthesis protein [Candidatus Brockarchaeota archaeon]
MGYEEHKRLSSQRRARCAVLTISDTRTEEDDESGKAMVEKLKEAGHSVSFYKVVKNDRASLKRAIEELLGSPEVDAVLTTGGTGIGAKDVTIEVASEIVEKRLEGFGEIFRALSYKEIGSGAIMSRAMMGVSRGKVLACMPGSRKAVELAVGLLAPELGHILWEAGRSSSGQSTP